MSDQRTIEYYNSNAVTYGNIVPSLDGNFVTYRNRFTDHLPQGSKVLDLGCGGGHVSLAFLEAGFDVVALDASSELAKIASQRTGLKVVVEDFEYLDYCSDFDGIWASASLTHLPTTGVESVLHRINRALRPGGVFVASFKCAESDWRDTNGRLFGAIDAQTLQAMSERAGLLVDSIDLVEGHGLFNDPATWAWLHSRKGSK